MLVTQMLQVERALQAITTAGMTHTPIEACKAYIKGKMLEEIALWESEEKVGRGEVDYINWWARNHHNYKVLPRMVGLFFGKPIGAHSCERNWSKTGNICEPKRNQLDPIRVGSLVLVSETVLNFAGIRYDNKPPVENIFLKLFLEKRGNDEKRIYENARVHILETSDESSADENDTTHTPEQARASIQPHQEDEQHSDSEEESQDVLRPLPRTT